VRIAFEGRDYPLEDGETVLDCLVRQGAQVASFCRSGACQSCMLRVEEGEVPPSSQQGLKAAWRAQGYFLPCICRPAGDLRVSRCEATGEFSSRIVEVERLSPQVLRVMLSRPEGFDYQGGQFVQLRRADGLMRPYSLASIPEDPLLELHVALLPGGRLSSWLAGAIGEPVTLRGPYGECFHVAEEKPRPLLLAGTGTGLAPLQGVLRAALRAGHGSQIRLLHGAASREGLYMWEPLQQLGSAHPQLELGASILAGEEAPGITCRPLQDMVLQSGLPLGEARIYLCGNEQFVRGMRRQLYLAGAALDRIHADAFLPPGDRTD
jgi:ferredoxin-NADP reductase/ferredoxin